MASLLMTAPPLVVLITPPTGRYRRDDRCQSLVDAQTVRVVFAPLDLAYLAASLEQSGCLCTIRDYPAWELSEEQALADLRSLRPTALIATVIQPAWEADWAFLDRVRGCLPEVYIVVRGESCQARLSTMGHVGDVDAVLLGECEDTVAQLGGRLWVPGIGRAQAGAVLASIPGVAFPSHGGWRSQGPAQLIEPLDRLPFPARHLLDHRLYLSPESGNPLATIETARGCPYQCIFCPAPGAHGRRVRARSVEQVVAEIARCCQEQNVTEFLFHADTFTFDRRWVLELCAELRRRELPVRWGCNSRVDTVDQELLAAMKAAGCWVIGFGVESGSDQTLKRIHKGVTLAQILRAFQWCREAGIRSHAFFVIGFPWQTAEDLAAELAFARRLDPDFFDFNIVYPLPGAPLYDMVVEAGLFIPDQAGAGYGRAGVRTETLSPEQLNAWRRKALLRLYLRPHYIARTLAKAGSYAKVCRYARAAAWRFAALLRKKL